MKKKDYQYTLAIAKLKSFNKAAEYLYISQPALSRHISELEKRINTPLFDRKSSPIKLTPAGECFCNYASEILALEEKMMESLNDFSVNRRKPVRIGVPLISGDYVLDRLFTDKGLKFPLIQLDPISDISGNLCKRLLSGQIDLAVISSEYAESTIKSEFLFDEPIYLATAYNHPALAGYDVSEVSINEPLRAEFAAFQDIPLIHCKPLSIMSYVAEDVLKKKGFKTNSYIKASSLDLAFRLAAKGIGITSVMRSQLKYGHPKDVEKLCPIALEDCKLKFYISYNTSTYNVSQDIRALIAGIKEEFKKKPAL